MSDTKNSSKRLSSGAYTEKSKAYLVIWFIIGAKFVGPKKNTSFTDYYYHLLQCPQLV